MTDLYFRKILKLIGYSLGNEAISYDALLDYLYRKEFTYSIENDENRLQDGLDLRYRFAGNKSFEPCSVLEMMIALADRIESTIMDDPTYGNRTGQWFWRMITNLGLGSMTDDQFDIRYVEEVVDRFLDREYEPDGRGGLFTVRGSGYDLRNVEIWIIAMWYLDSFV